MAYGVSTAKYNVDVDEMRAINRNQFALLLNEQNQRVVGRRTS